MTYKLIIHGEILQNKFFEGFYIITEKFLNFNWNYINDFTAHNILKINIISKLSTYVLRLIDRVSYFSILRRRLKSVKVSMVDDNKKSTSASEPKKDDEITRRDFVVNTAVGVAAVGAAASLIPFVSSLSPSDEVLAVGTTEVDLTKIPEGQTITVMWRGNPVFVTHRTSGEIEKARSVDVTALKDPEEDEARVEKGHDKWLVTIAVCTHLGCVPIPNKGEYDGWFCPCHGSHYDTSARIRKGPAPSNLPVPPYKFLDENKILIG